MIKRVKLETIYKMAKEDNEEIKDRKLFPDGWDEKVYDYYNKLSKESSDVEMFMEFLGGEDSPLEMAYAYRRNMYIIHSSSAHVEKQLFPHPPVQSAQVSEQFAVHV